MLCGVLWLTLGMTIAECSLGFIFLATYDCLHLLHKSRACPVSPPAAVLVCQIMKSPPSYGCHGPGGETWWIIAHILLLEPSFLPFSYFYWCWQGCCAWGWFTDAELIYKILELSNCCSKAWLSLQSSIPIVGELTDCVCLKASFDKVLRMKTLEALSSRSPDHSVVPCLLQLRGMCLCAVSGVSNIWLLLTTDTSPCQASCFTIVTSQCT